LVNTHATDKDDRVSGLSQMLHVALLMEGSPFPENFQQWIPNFGLLEDTVGDSDVEACQMVAVEMPYQV
jgi:hypothetical protein